MNEILRMIRSFPFTTLDLENEVEMDFRIAFCDMQIAEIYKNLLASVLQRKLIDDYFYQRVFRR